MSFGVYSVGLMNLLPKCETALHDFFNALEHEPWPRSNASRKTLGSWFVAKRYDSLLMQTGETIEKTICNVRSKDKRNTC